MLRKKIHKSNRRQDKVKRARRSARFLTGILHIIRPQVGSVITPEGTFTLARHGIREGMDGDEVQVSLTTAKGREPRATVCSVLTRATSTFLGRYEVADPLGVVVPLNARIQRDFFVLPEDSSPARCDVSHGDIVVARIVEYPTRTSAAVVTLERRVGSSNELDMNIESVIASFGLATEFSQRSLTEASFLLLDVNKELADDASRVDLRGEFCVTIDPSDAKDFDDAVGARRLSDGGYELDVHIADVSRYVSWGSSIDLEARARTCSVYLVDRVLPMLPEWLCNDLCSLRPHEDRLTVSVRMRLNAEGVICSVQAMNAVIRSAARLSYEQVDALLEGKMSQDSPVMGDTTQQSALVRMLETLDEIRAKRQKIRYKRGAIDFETVETRMLLDVEGRPTGVSVRRRTRATNLIEEAMLLANESVAKMLADKDIKTAYRVHESPSPEALHAGLSVLVAIGALETGEAARITTGDSCAICGALEKSRGTGYTRVVNAVLLRAQKRAIYLPVNQGHYALGASAYCHFTSPIRRYSDILVHRALKSLLADEKPVVKGTRVGQTKSDEKAQLEQERALPQLCATCSERERVADAAARTSQKIKMAEFYQSRIGEEAWGTIDGVERFGLFVTLDATYAEGLLHVKDLGQEWIRYDEEQLMFIGEATGKRWRMGDRIKVRVSAVIIERGQIDFLPVDVSPGKGLPVKR
ncbi:ribonuclease R [Lancefieldella rimae]|uniref:Ribonuclease R n=3 Tax=Lancefieldella rimae TaxID=1383 RepID=B9CNE4_LANR4|nr:ribonuclease R [Lancefieldella rimae]EEE17002.1 putative ribonuclease R [Lancefieldella rimae ATCC 49626]OFR20835.1 3'-5' exonuclease [Atopobium sp. HMSC064B08]